MKNFAIIGVGGYIAPKHLQAIKDTGNRLVAALDISDSVGILDKYFPDTSFFLEFERFQRHLDKLRLSKSEYKVNYVSICSPNFLHDAHIRLAFNIEADAICEKPMVLNPWNLDALSELETITKKKVYNVLQLRMHPAIIKLKERISLEIRQDNTKKYNVNLIYITARGKWYDFSWKGDIKKSGGISTNIGIHFFDLLIWLFGKPVHSTILLSETRRASGELELKNAYVKWFLSIDFSDLPEKIVNEGKTTFRSIKIDEVELEFSEGFTNLHTEIYKQILDGKGFTIEDVRDSIELVYKIRNLINF